ncbi:MAG: prolipoprotein diacylglyceryl transferase [bacterium]|nr:prolipoprotein diacylglyceryl transferase [bacterium]
MFPVVFDLGTFDLPFLGETRLFLPTYGMLFAIAVLSAWWLFSRRAAAMGIPEEQRFNLTFYSLLAGILGAKLLLIFVDWRVYLLHPGEIFSLSLLRSAGVLVGGVFAGALTFALYCRRHALPLFRLADAMAAPLALAQALGRLGCFTAGCCWGKPTHAHSWFSVTFTHPDAAAQTGVPLNVPLVATQMIQMTHDLTLAVVLTILWRRRVGPPGTVFWIYVMIYSIGRGTIEFLRGDHQRGLYFDGLLSTTQLFSLVAFAVAAAMLVRGLRRADPVPS